MERESATTAKVLAAVPDSGKRDYKPDPKSRTAWELATHLAAGDVWFLQSILDGKFAWIRRRPTEAESQFKNVNDVVAFYKREVPARIKALRALPAEKLTQVVDFFGMMQQPNAAYLGIATTTASTTAASWRPTCARWDRRCRASTAAAPTNRWAT